MLTNGVNGTYGKTDVFLTHAGQTVPVTVVGHLNGVLGFVAVLLKVCIYRIFFSSKSMFYQDLIQKLMSVI